MSTSTATTNNYYSTPGEILDEEFLQPLSISRYRLAKSIGVSETAIGEIVNGRRRITTPWHGGSARRSTPRPTSGRTFRPTTIC